MSEHIMDNNKPWDRELLDHIERLIVGDGALRGHSNNSNSSNNGVEESEDSLYAFSTMLAETAPQADEAFRKDLLNRLLRALPARAESDTAEHKQEDTPSPNVG